MFVFSKKIDNITSCKWQVLFFTDWVRHPVDAYCAFPSNALVSETWQGYPKPLVDPFFHCQLANSIIRFVARRMRTLQLLYAAARLDACP
jgi:hypothetical protein